MLIMLQLEGTIEHDMFKYFVCNWLLIFEENCNMNHKVIISIDEIDMKIITAILGYFCEIVLIVTSATCFRYLFKISHDVTRRKFLQEFVYIRMQHRINVLLHIRRDIFG